MQCYFVEEITPKTKRSKKFCIPYTIGQCHFERALCDLGASVNLMPLSVYKKLGLGEVKPTTVSLLLADRSIKHPRGVLEDVLVKVDKLIFPADFIILDMEEDQEIPIILGRPFLATGRTLIDVQQGKLTLRVQDNQVSFNIFKALSFPDEGDTCYRVDTVTSCTKDVVNEICMDQPLAIGMVDVSKSTNPKVLEQIRYLEANSPIFIKKPFEDLGERLGKPVPSIEKAPILELKALPSHLKYAYLGENSTLLVIVSAVLTPDKEEKLLRVLREYKTAFGWSIADIRGISPSICMHKILMEDNYKPSVEHQRRLNPNMKEVVRKEVIKWLEAGIIYPISDSQWVSPVQVVPKKGGMTVVPNEKNELIPQRTVTGWRVCIDYRKLNKATRKDHFPLSFIGQMFDRLAGKAY